MSLWMFLGISLWRYVCFELTRGYWLEHDRARFAERRKRVYTFMKIPRELEKVGISCFGMCLFILFYILMYFGLIFVVTVVKYFHY